MFLFICNTEDFALVNQIITKTMFCYSEKTINTQYLNHTHLYEISILSKAKRFGYSDVFMISKFQILSKWSLNSVDTYFKFTIPLPFPEECCISGFDCVLKYLLCKEKLNGYLYNQRLMYELSNFPKLYSALKISFSTKNLQKISKIYHTKSCYKVCKKYT